VLVVLEGHLYLKGSLYHKILLLQEFNNILGKVLRSKKAASNLRKKISFKYQKFTLKSENFSVTLDLKDVH
jgi:hypothetical protein